MEKQQDKSLDNLRALAIILVVLIHTEEQILDSLSSMMRLPTSLVWLLVYSVGRLSVSFFLILTGYLQLGKSFNETESVLKFYKHSLLPLLKKSFIGYLFLVMFDMWKGISYSIPHIILQLLFLRPWPGIQTWYIPVILGVYLVIPYVAKAMELVDKTPKISLYILGIIVFYEFIAVDILNVFEVIFNISITNMVNIQFLHYYGVYLVLGFMLKKKILNSISNKKLVFGLCLSLFCLVSEQKLLYHFGEIRFLWYNSGFILLAALFSAELIINRGLGFKNNNLVNVISKHSFTIFWIHSAIQEIIFSLLKFKKNQVGLVQYGIYFILTFLVSLSSSIFLQYILKKVNIVRRKV